VEGVSVRRVGSRRSEVGSYLLPVLGALLLTATGCGPEDRTIEGSLSEVVELRYRKVDVLMNPTELSLRFLEPQGAGENVVLRVSVDLTGTQLDAIETFDLAERGKVSRSVLDDPLTSFPAIRLGQLTFRRSLVSGDTVPGEFNVTFVNGTELSSGRTAFATFEALVQ
jgi:hypothetical protein